MLNDASLERGFRIKTDALLQYRASAAQRRGMAETVVSRLPAKFGEWSRQGAASRWKRGETFNRVCVSSTSLSAIFLLTLPIRYVMDCDIPALHYRVRRYAEAGGLIQRQGRRTVAPVDVATRPAKDLSRDQPTGSHLFLRAHAPQAFPRTRSQRTRHPRERSRPVGARSPAATPLHQLRG